jgi:hypothetical protein
MIISLLNLIIIHMLHKVTRHVEQQLLTPSGAPESTTCFSGIRVPRPLVLDSFLHNVL